MALVGGAIVDMAGVARAKYVPAARLEAFHTVGMGASPSWSVFALDGSIAFTPGLGVVGDNRIRIDPANVRCVGDGALGPSGPVDDHGIAHLHQRVEVRKALVVAHVHAAVRGAAVPHGREVRGVVHGLASREEHRVRHG